MWLGRAAGLSDEDMLAMADAEAHGGFDATDRLVLRYAEILTKEIRVPDVLYAELSARFPKDELFELCMAVAFSAMVNRVHATFRTDLDDRTHEMFGEHAPACPIG